MKKHSFIKKEHNESKTGNTFNSKFKEKIDKYADSMPEILTGNKELMHQKYAAIYGNSTGQKMVLETTRRTGKMYLLAACIFIVIILAFIIKSILSPEVLMDLSRSSYEGDSKVLSTKVEAEYKGESQKKAAEIIIQPKGLTEKEKKMRIRKTKKNLGSLILSENPDLNNVTSKLDLATVDPETGVEIAWKSGDERLIDDDGIVNPLIARENEKVVLDAQLRLEEVTDSIRINISFGKPTSGKEMTDAITASVNNLISDLNENDSGERLILPDKTAEGVSLKWKQNETLELLFK